MLQNKLQQMKDTLKSFGLNVDVLFWDFIHRLKS